MSVGLLALDRVILNHPRTGSCLELETVGLSTDPFNNETDIHTVEQVQYGVYCP